MCNLLVNRQEKFGLDPNKPVYRPNRTWVHATLTGLWHYRSRCLASLATTSPHFLVRSRLILIAQREGDGLALLPMARPAQGDHTTGLAMVGAILAALRLAEKSRGATGG